MLTRTAPTSAAALSGPFAVVAGLDGGAVGAERADADGYGLGIVLGVQVGGDQVGAGGQAASTAAALEGLTCGLSGWA